MAGLPGCDATGQARATGPALDPPGEGGVAATVVDLATERLGLELTRSEIVAGWTTFRYENDSGHARFFRIEKLPRFDRDGDGSPEQLRLADYIEDRTKPFQNLMDDMVGRAPSFPGADFGGWDLEHQGGSVVTRSGGTSEVTVWLDPGVYVIECYVESPGGAFHVVEGMADELRVKDPT